MGHPDIVLYQTTVNGHVAHRNTCFLGFVDDTALYRHGLRTTLVNAGILKSRVVKNGDGGQYGGGPAVGIARDFNQPYGPELVRAPALERGCHRGYANANHQEGSGGVKTASTI